MLRIEFPQGREQGNSRDNIKKVGGGGNYYQNLFSILEREKKHLAYVEVDLTVSKLETKRHEPQ